ncbi:unnamed protein product [Larinioides sclopetarius]|uniref:Ycf15 n=1 Tax=Larinioides sclopetarius TaxID=280406 RepID=A0AAV2AXU2_9ARAC
MLSIFCACCIDGKLIMLKAKTLISRAPLLGIHMEPNHCYIYVILKSKYQEGFPVPSQQPDCMENRNRRRNGQTFLESSNQLFRRRGQISTVSL